MENRSLIITADDYGMCKPVNDAINTCIESGLVKSTNVIVNMEATEESKWLRGKYPELSVGIHWNITAGLPVSDPSYIPSLVDSSGRFHSLGMFKELYRKRKINDRDIRTELYAQYNKFKMMCGEPDYWNTHQNSSVDFFTFKIFYNTAKELGINKTRNFQRVYADTKDKLGLYGLMIELLKKALFEVWYGVILKNDGTKMANGRMIYFDDRNIFDLPNISTNIKWGRKRVVELVIHPSTNAEYQHFGNISTLRVDHFKMFSNRDTFKWLLDNNINLISFHEI